MAAYDVITKANLQYYDGKLKREIEKKGTLNGITFQGEQFTKRYQNDQLYSGDDIDMVRTRPSKLTVEKDWDFCVSANTFYEEYSYEGRKELEIYKAQESDGKRYITIENRRWNGGEMSDYSIIQLGRIYLKSDVDSIFATASGHKFKEISTTQFPTIESFLDLQSTNWDATGEGYMSHSDRREDTIYLYPKTENGVRYFDEYLYEPGEPPAGPSDGGVAPSFEFLGTLKQDLTGYVKEEDIPETDNDYIDGLFLRNLEPGIYNASGKMVRSWAQLTDKSKSSPVFVINDLGFALYGYNGSLYADQISDNGKTLIIPASITTVTPAASSISGAPTDNLFEGLEFLDTILFKGNVGLDTNSRTIFKDCTLLRRVYTRNDFPNFIKESVASAKFIQII